MSEKPVPETLLYVEELEVRLTEAERRITRLRKAVNWLRGANHDAIREYLNYPSAQDAAKYAGLAPHQGTVYTCDVWECQRARDILAEDHGCYEGEFYTGSDDDFRGQGA